MFDGITGTKLYTTKVTNDRIFVTCLGSKGLWMLEKGGGCNVLSINKNNLLNHVRNNLGSDGQSICLRLVSQCNLEGGSEILKSQFNSLFNEGRYKEAADIISNCDELRNTETLNRFKSVDGVPKPVLL